VRPSTERYDSVRSTTRPFLYAFDIIELNGEDMRRLMWRIAAGATPAITL
jgi:ATP-dependent DNA ligase